MNFIVRVVLMALLFTFVFPTVAPGVQIHGAFWPEGIVCGLLFVGVGIVVGLLAVLFSFFTLGIGLVLLAILQMFIPALTLQLMATWFPGYLTVVNWEAAVIAGLCIWVVNFVLSRLGSSK
jgi:uncharacterized membrane protein YvlD (DUF360 family)